MHSVRSYLRLWQVHAPSRFRFNAAKQGRFARCPRRCVHTLQALPYEIDDGLGEFLPPAALHMIAVEYQQGLLTRLNEQVKGTPMEHQSVTQTVISAAGNRRHALAFNYASQALNNSFFLHFLKPPPSNEADMGEFREAVRMNFGTLEQLKSTFSAAAMGMINSGWVWLVTDENGNMQVVGTFGAGTLLVRSRRHMLEDEDKPRPILGEVRRSVYKAPLTGGSAPATSSASHSTAPTSPNSGLQHPIPGLSPSTPFRSLHGSSFTQLYESRRPNVFGERSMSQPETVKTVDYDDIGDILTPILCVSVYEHAWVGAGYGVWGKEEYLKQFWTVVNWEAVKTAYEKALRYR